MNRHQLYRYILDWFFPNVCPSCGGQIAYDEDFCGDCLNEIELFNEDYAIDGIGTFTAYCVYDDNISRILNTFKQDSCGNTYYAFAFGIMQALRKRKLTDEFDMIVSVPMTKADFRKRGYNQVELIAEELRHLIEKPYVKALIKVKETEHQKYLGENERRENVKGAFSVKKGISVEGKRILVIDDVCTTGSTIAEAARALKEAGASEVYGASFAKTRIKP